MARLFALADLHLSLAGHKPMDIFGELWTDHAVRMAEAWDATVGDDDAVLLAGDLSWGKNLAEAAPDLEWIGARPGRKLLLKGNHDTWWTSRSRVRSALPDRCEVLQNDAHEIDGRVIVGARGWTSPDDPISEPKDAAVFHREIERLKLSIAHADRNLDRELPRIAMLHYPPWVEGQPPTAVVPLLRDAGVRIAIYGHLHGEDHKLAIQGERDGIDFRFVAADAVDFTPVEIQ